MRVVADTNTVVPALLWGGLPAAILTAARVGHITLYASCVLIAELTEVLSRTKFSARIARVGASTEELVGGYRALITVVRPTRIEPTSRDPDDDHVLACALSAGAALIVTRDRDLLDLVTFREVHVLSARKALDLINQRFPKAGTENSPAP